MQYFSRFFESRFLLARDTSRILRDSAKLRKIPLPVSPPNALVLTKVGVSSSYSNDEFTEFHEVNPFCLDILAEVRPLIEVATVLAVGAPPIVSQERGSLV